MVGVTCKGRRTEGRSPEREATKDVWAWGRSSLSVLGFLAKQWVSGVSRRSYDYAG
jgi:hypothetical protein